jgi:hypothetical protein
MDYFLVSPCFFSVDTSGSRRGPGRRTRRRELIVARFAGSEGERGGRVRRRPFRSFELFIGHVGMNLTKTPRIVKIGSEDNAPPLGEFGTPHQPPPVLAMMGFGCPPRRK